MTIIDGSVQEQDIALKLGEISPGTNGEIRTVKAVDEVPNADSLGRVNTGERSVVEKEGDGKAASKFVSSWFLHGEAYDNACSHSRRFHECVEQRAGFEALQ